MNFIVNSTDSETDFSGVEDPITFLNNIKTNKITIEEAKALQEDFNNYVITIRRGKKLKSKRKHCQILIDFWFLWPKKKAATKGEGLKILTPKQMIQRLPVALAQIKAGSNLEHLLNEIRQIFYSLHQSKEITKKVYNSTIKSIQI